MPTRTVKYLGILLDQNLQWSKQISEAEMKLSQSVGTLGKLRDKKNDNILKMGYHSLFTPLLNYKYQLWGQSSTATQKTMKNLEN